MSASLAPAMASNTDAILAAFNLTGHAEQFARTLYSMRAFISGGFALYWYMNKHSKTPVPFPDAMDMDIWIPGVSSDWHSNMLNNYVCLHAFELVLGGMVGYKRQSDMDRQKELEARRVGVRRDKPTGEIDYLRSPGALMITKIINYIHPVTGRKIQLIFLNDTFYPSKVTSTFDLDICKFVIHAGSDGVLRVDVPEDNEDYDGMTARGIMKRLIEEKVMTLTLEKLQSYYLPNLLARVEKYYGRGFVLEGSEPPCPCCKRPYSAKKRLTLEEAKEVARAMLSSAATKADAA